MTELAYTNEFTARKLFGEDARIEGFKSLSFPGWYVLCLSDDCTKPTNMLLLRVGRQWIAAHYPVEWAIAVLDGKLPRTAALLFEINPEEPQ